MSALYTPVSDRHNSLYSFRSYRPRSSLSSFRLPCPNLTTTSSRFSRSTDKLSRLIRSLPRGISTSVLSLSVSLCSPFWVQSSFYIMAPIRTYTHTSHSTEPQTRRAMDPSAVTAMILVLHSTPRLSHLHVNWQQPGSFGEYYGMFGKWT